MTSDTPAAGAHKDTAARALQATHATETFSLLQYLQLHTYDAKESSSRNSAIGSTAKCIRYQHVSTVQVPPQPGSPYLGPLVQSKNPRFPSCTVRVIPKDSLDAALNLGPPIHLPTPPQTYRNVPRPALILNLANGQYPGGGWRHGSLAQEESLMYRTSLASALPTRHSTLNKDFYAGTGWASTDLFLHPCVAVIRESLADGHGLLPIHRPERLRMVSVLSCAAIQDPKLERAVTLSGRLRLGFNYREDRSLTREKIRGILRVAAKEKYNRIVLGALGCGAFSGPSEEVADLFREVLEDLEFGGWFEEVVFAILPGKGGDGNDNYSVFKAALDGVIVGG